MKRRYVIAGDGWATSCRTRLGARRALRWAARFRPGAVVIVAKRGKGGAAVIARIELSDKSSRPSEKMDAA